METTGYRGRSCRQELKGKIKKGKKISYFRNVYLGGLDKNQIIYCLWDIVKSVEAAQGADSLARLGKQLRSQIRVRIRRYFVRRRRRSVRMAFNVVVVIICTAAVLDCLIGMNRVSGNSIYPYLGHGDWIVCNRMGEKYQKNEIIVFGKNEESMVKRITSLPGGRVELNSPGGRVVVNRQEIQEDYVTLSDATAGDKNEKAEEPPGMTQTVMNGQYLVLGDSHSVSIDSRNSNTGTVPSEEILGRVVLVIRGNRG